MRSYKQNLSLFFAISFFIALASCSGGSGGEGVGDTVYLESGVKYIYLKKGDGLKVDSGSHVTTHINLIVNQDTIWSTYAPDQQRFEFDAKRTSLISGFDEVVMYAREGDRLLAVIPPELGYGEEGSGVVPPNAILHFDLDFLKVEEPKIFISDVINEKLESGSIEDALAEYDRLKADTANYNVAISEWYAVHRKLMEDGKFETAIQLWEHRLKESFEGGGYYFMAQAYDSLGNVQQAIATLETAKANAPDTNAIAFIYQYAEALKSR